MRLQKFLVTKEVYLMSTVPWVFKKKSSDFFLLVTFINNNFKNSNDNINKNSIWNEKSFSQKFKEWDKKVRPRRLLGN